MKSEKANWEEGDVWVTDKVGFHMRNTIKKARKNYLSIYDNPTDPLTGRQKVFVPFTEWTVDNVYKNIDLDLKDVKVVSRKPDAYGISKIFRYILNTILDKANFSFTLNEMLKNGVCVDGTGFLKVWREGRNLCIKFIDRLNMIVDPSAETLDDTPVMERNLLTISEAQEYEKDWENFQFIKGQNDVDRVSGLRENKVSSEIPYVEVFERYGYLPLFCLTGDEKDKDTYEYMLSIVSNLDGEPICHKIKKVKKHPYGMFKLKTVKNRLDGRGAPETVFNIQAFLNEVINSRLNVSRIAQTQLFKLRGNITPQQLSRLFQTGAIKLDGASDIEPIDTGTIDPSSYKDEEQAYQWGQRVTQTVREDEVTSSTPATNALIQERGAAKGYNQIQEGLSIALSKFLEEKVTPLIKEIIKMEPVLKFTGDAQDLETLDDKLAKNLIYTEFEKYKSKWGYYPFLTEMELDQKIEDLKDQLKAQGNVRYMQMDEDSKNLFDTDYDIAIELDEERINPSVEAQQLVQLMGIMGQAGMPIEPMLTELLDLMGKDPTPILERIKQARQQQQMQMQQAQQAQMMGQMGGVEGINPLETQPNAPEGPVTQVPKPSQV